MTQTYPGASSATLRQVREAITHTLATMPRGGSERERQAYRNGVRELAQVLGERLGGNERYFEPETSGPHRPLYEDGGRQAGIDYMEEQVDPCEYCGKTGTRREAIEHIQDPCPGLLASQEAGEALINMINAQQPDPEPF